MGCCHQTVVVVISAAKTRLLLSVDAGLLASHMGLYISLVSNLPSQAFTSRACLAGSDSDPGPGPDLVRRSGCDDERLRQQQQSGRSGGIILYMISNNS